MVAVFEKWKFFVIRVFRIKSAAGSVIFAVFLNLLRNKRWTSVVYDEKFTSLPCLSSFHDLYLLSVSSALSYWQRIEELLKKHWWTINSVNQQRETFFVALGKGNKTFLPICILFWKAKRNCAKRHVKWKQNHKISSINFAEKKLVSSNRCLSQNICGSKMMFIHHVHQDFLTSSTFELG